MIGMDRKACEIFQIILELNIFICYDTNIKMSLVGGQLCKAITEYIIKTVKETLFHGT